MKNDSQEIFLKKYREEKPMFQAWGDYVQKYICEKLKEMNEDLSKIIKIQSSPR